MTPEQKRIELLEARVKELEETLLYVSNTLGLYGVFSGVEVDVARNTYHRGHQMQIELGMGDWNWSRDR